MATPSKYESAGRRLSEIVASPYRLMQHIAEVTADYLVPDPVPAAKAPSEPQARAASSPPRAKPSPARAKPSPARSKPSPAKVKQEPSRELPFRRSARSVKVGFYNEANLAALAWKGTGSSVDPIQVE